MRIGIDAHVLGKGIGGAERYVAKLVQLLPLAAPEHEYVVFADTAAAAALRPPGNVRIVVPAARDPLIARPVLLPLLARRHRLDVLQVQRIAPPLPGCKIMLTVHDLLPIACPADHRGFRNMLIRLLTPASIRAAHHVVTVSRTMAALITERYRLQPGRVSAVYNGVDHDLFTPQLTAPDGQRLSRFNIKNPFILYVGAIEPRKNLAILLEAFKIVRDARGGAVDLVIAGMTRSADYGASLEGLAASLGIAGALHRTGFIPDADCVELMHAAQVFVAPSRGEGFDLPPLEAMACGVPVVCSDIDVHRELFTEAAAFFKTDSAQNLAEALQRVWDSTELRSALQRQGLATAQKFTWENTACNLARLYRSIAADLKA